jgi:hypothetical protein
LFANLSEPILFAVELGITIWGEDLCRALKGNQYCEHERRQEGRTPGEKRMISKPHRHAKFANACCSRTVSLHIGRLFRNRNNTSKTFRARNDCSARLPNVARSL